MTTTAMIHTTKVHHDHTRAPGRRGGRQAARKSLEESEEMVIGRGSRCYASQAPGMFLLLFFMFLSSQLELYVL